jgi:hypothetical protein
MSFEVDVEDSLPEDTERLLFYNSEEELFYDARLHIRYKLQDGEKILVAGATTVTGMIDKSGPLTMWAANQTVAHLRNTVLPDTPYTQEQLDTAFNDARFNYRKTSRTALDIGKLAHTWLDAYQQRLIANPNEYENVQLLPDNEKARNCVVAALDWMNKHNFKPFCVEKQVYSRKYQFSGTYDHLAWITACGDKDCCPFEGTIFTLGDFKSSKRIYEEYRLQTACYKCAHEEEFPDLPIDARLVIRLDKEGDGIETSVLLNDTYEADLDGFLGTLDLYNWTKALDYDKRYAKQLAKSLKPKSKRKPRKPVVIREVEIGIPFEEAA